MQLTITTQQGPGISGSAPPVTLGNDIQQGITAVHIKEFKEQKRPRSANEMAALVAYYLANLTSKEKRKETVNQKDILDNFKIAAFPLPKQPRGTLPNAKNAGYFDLAGDGEYKLNAVGHNLVVHSMPHGEVATRKTPKKRKVVQKKNGKRSKKLSKQ